ncbi:SphA family protein [Seleniivibrio woodruffii]|uniref:Outer membrane beta-barrel porin/alpha-amylase n=1 Tax=Seleniivibrio woodruffii TaxID=1078050 RepID=A0A4R1K318_9BACT|nr:transporter [Seleniivibrio woodruffii]TCK58466.1 hypothetical protein C8D98_2669 [Seleniivibrio woodruffii]TVZ36839.1 hypothetical protein OF66_2478 [Seleniivibrio woodruffii]
MLRKIGLLTVACIFCSFFSVFAQDYAVGTEGLKAGSVPGPGMYYLMYNNYYSADKTVDKNGDKKDIGFDVHSFANVHRFVYITDKKILGADYGFNVILPIVNADLNIDAANIDTSKTALGDITVEPFLLSWHRDTYDMSFGSAIILPTGEYDKTKALNIGKDHYTALITYGATYYFDDAKSVAVSGLARYEKHFENNHSDITYGDDIDFEWGLSKDINRGVTAGLAGYAHWQISDDKGNDVNYDASVHDHVYGIGPEIDFFVPAIKSLFKVKVYKEFNAADTSEGTSSWVTFVKPF